MSGKARILSIEEVIAVAKELPPIYKGILFIGCYTGLRVSEIISLRYQQLFDERGKPRQWLVVKRLKKRGDVYSRIPIHTRLQRTLTHMRDDLGKDWLFCSPDKPDQHVSRQATHDALKKAFKRFQLFDAKTHSMRRTCMTLMKREGVPLTDIQAISGHSNLSQLSAYLEADDNDLEDAISKLNFG